MDDKLRRLQAAIAYTGIPKKALARHCGISRSLFSMYLCGDATMPAEVEDKLMARIRKELDSLLPNREHAAWQQVNS